MIINDSRHCRECKTDKTLDCFSPSKIKNNDLICRPCVNKKTRDYFNAHPDLRRHHKFMERYGINIGDYNKMFADQNGRCLLCLRHQNELPKSLRVDHNHLTGKVRGLLCEHCNIAIGLLRENVEVMQRAINYVTRNL